MKTLLNKKLETENEAQLLDLLINQLITIDVNKENRKY